MRLVTYMYISLAHLIPVEITFAVISHRYPEFSDSILFFNYIYGILCCLHGIHYWKDRAIQILAQKLKHELGLGKKSHGETVLAGFGGEE